MHVFKTLGDTKGRNEARSVTSRGGNPKTRNIEKNHVLAPTATVLIEEGRSIGTAGLRAVHRSE